MHNFPQTKNFKHKTLLEVSEPLLNVDVAEERSHIKIPKTGVKNDSSKF